MGVLERSEKLYNEQGRELIHRLFPQEEGRIAVGLAGHGSECFGFDDEISLDHDCELGFMLWLNDEDDIKFGVELERAYKTLAGEREGARTAPAGKVRGVVRISDFYTRYTGSKGAPESWQQWMALPSFALAECTNGQVWRDDSSEFSAIREKILRGMPEDVRKKKMAARAMTMAQAGQYNYTRCLRHGERGAAMLAMGEFVNAACETVYLLNRAHMPYYKWALRGMKRLEKLGDICDALEFLLTADNDGEGQKLKAGVIEDICAEIIRELQNEGLTDGGWDYLEPHAYEIMERIESAQIRAMHIME